MILMIDNYDSFTYNLVQYFGELDQHVKVFRNDQIGLEEITAMKPKHIVISPGPGVPDKAGITLQVIERFSGQVPILGVCLGMQAIGQAFGGKVVHASSIKHGKTSPIRHQNTGVFEQLANPFTATRYHSLVIERQSMPSVLEEIAWSEDADEDGVQEIMGLRHREHPVTGVQFHPESILTEHGHRLLQNFLNGCI